jgi:hypothetical protein
MNGRLTEGQELLLTALNSVDGWMPLAWVKSPIGRSAPSLVARGLIKIRGGVGVKSIRLPVEVAITPSGRLALSDKERE